MPTVTSMGTVTVTNMGPLLTTFTAPASCTAGTELLKVATSESLFVDAWFNQCGSQVLMGTLKECWPSGAATIDEFVSRNYRNPTTGILGYYSPGIACPAGWTTAGVTTRNTDGSPGSASGAFILPAPTITRPDYLDFIPGFAQIIDPGETAAVCCPSGYTLLPSAGWAYTVLPTSVYQPSAGATVCAWGWVYDSPKTQNTTLTFNGHATPTQVLLVPESAGLTEYTTTISPAEVTHMVGWRAVGLIPLIHKAEDLSAASNNPAATSSSPAQALRPAPSGMLGIWQLVVVAAMVTAGASLMFSL